MYFYKRYIIICYYLPRGIKKCTINFSVVKLIFIFISSLNINKKIDKIIFKKIIIYFERLCLDIRIIKNIILNDFFL